MNEDHERFVQGVRLYEEGTRCREAGQYETAQEYYAKAREILAGRLDITIFYDMALAHDFAGNFQEATSCFKQCVVESERYQPRDPSDQTISNMVPFINGVRDHLKLRSVAKSVNKDYLEYMRAMLWPRASFPLKIFVDNSKEFGFDGSVIDLIHTAIDSWLTELPGHSCKYVSIVENPDIIIVRAKAPDESNQTYGGQTTYDYSNDSKTILSRATIRLFSAAYSMDDAWRQKFHSLVLHEFGHALGLDGHSPYGEDLMYWKSQRLDLGECDRATIKLLYC